MPNNKLNAKEQRLLEEKIKFSFETDNVITDEEIDAIKQSAFEDYMNSQEYRQKSIQRKEKTRTIAKRLVAVTAVAIILFVAPFVYSVLMPVTMSKADAVIRYAAIWINETFELGFEFTAPVDEPTNNNSYVQIPASSSIQTIEDLAKQTNNTIVYLPTDENIRLDCISYDNSLAGYEQISIQYKVNETATIVIDISPISDESTIRFHDNLIQFKTEAGIFFAWTNTSSSRAVAYVGPNKIDIFSSLPINSFIEYCKKLTILN